LTDSLQQRLEGHGSGYRRTTMLAPIVSEIRIWKGLWKERRLEVN
jgi:hypothetical protein